MSKKAYLYAHNNPLVAIEITDFFVIGYDGGCNLFINDPSLSPRHARIEFKDGNYFIRDLRSATGTYVNGTQILEAFLNEGDKISLGNSTFYFSFLPKKESAQLSSKNAKWSNDLSLLQQIANTHYPVLILGPSGTGKELIAESIHKNSPRSHGPFVSVNCSALTESLVESELFGHVKGSFTGAITDRKGAFEAARGGTLFLDEIGDLPQTMQAKLLRAIENNEIRAVGSDRNIETDVRIVAATHQNLKEKIAEGSFRMDLYYRLNVVTITPPALVDRLEDFEDLVYSFARSMRVRFSHNAIVKLKHHRWPGNIRELKNTVARASALYPQMLIEETHVEKILDEVSLQATHTTARQVGQLPVIKEIEKQMIIKRLVANQGNQRKTASDLGIPKSTLHDRIKVYQIDTEQFKKPMKYNVG